MSLSPVRSDVSMREREALEALQAIAAELPREDLPRFLGEIERIRTEILFTRLAAVPPASAPEPPAPEERLLSPKQVAERLGCSPWWVYQNKASLPIVRLQTGRYKFSEKKLARWLERRAG